MRIALAQLNPTSGDITGNTAKILAALEAAAAAGADLVVTPEMALPGYCIGDLVEDAGFLAANERALLEIAKAARGITAVVGFVDFDQAARNESGAVQKFNAAGVLRDGCVLQRAHKTLLPSYRYFDDKRFFVAARPVSACRSAKTCGTSSTPSSRSRSWFPRERTYSSTSMPRPSARGSV